LSAAERTFMSSKKYLRGFDNDSGMTMLRIGSMNLMLHGIQSPQFFYMDTLSKGYDGAGEFDVILMNPPFKGAVDKGDVHPDLPSDTTKSELLFLHLILRALDMGGRAAVIVPDGVLFGSSRAHVEIRKKIIEENRLDGVVSMPSGVFKPYAGVSTAVLLFTKGAQTKDIWFYDMEHDGFSLDDKRVKVEENDIPDILECWKNRFNPDFQSARAKRIADLRRELTPLKAERLRLQAEINRLQFESVLNTKDTKVTKENQNESFESLEPFVFNALNDAQAKLAELQSQISTPQSELDRLTRQFWVTKEQVCKGGATLRPNYDLSASRYRQVDADAAYHEKPSVTLERLARLEGVMLSEIDELKKLLK
jgi:type I restriction enzyme M protein